MNFFKDNLVWIIPSIIAAITILVQVSLEHSKRKIKKLTYEITTNKNIIKVDDDNVKNKLNISFDGQTGEKKITELNLIVLKIENSGSEPVLKEDYEEELEFSADEEVEIYDVEVTNDLMKYRVKPELNPITENDFFINPILINKNEFIEIKLLTSKPTKLKLTDGRLIGGIVEEKKESQSINLLYVSLFGLLIFIVAFILNVLGNNSSFVITLMFIGVLIIYGSYGLRRSNRIHVKKVIKNIKDDFQF